MNSLYCLPPLPTPFLKGFLWPHHPMFKFTVRDPLCGKFPLIIMSVEAQKLIFN